MTVVVRAGATIRTLARMQSYIRTPFMSMNSQTVGLIEDHARDSMLNAYTQGVRSEWEPIDWRTAIFSRQNRSVSGIRTGGQLFEVGADRTKLPPLIDTERLFKSVTDRHHKDAYVRITASRMVIGTKVPYARKHLEGLKQVFDFGATEERRTKERLTGKLAKSITSYGHALLNYPKYIEVPVRSWVKPIRKGLSLKILTRIQADLDKFIKSGTATGSVQHAISAMKIAQSKGSEE